MRAVRLAIVSVLAVPALLVAPHPAGAATIVVSTTADVVNAGDGVTSLREAFTTANGNGANDTIELAAGATYNVTACGSGGLVHTAPQALTIHGNGATLVQHCTDMRVLSSTNIAATSVFTVDALHIVGGPNSGANVIGAGIWADGRLVLSNSEISGVDGGPGGSVIASEFKPAGPDVTIVVSGSSLHDNRATVIDGDFLSATVTGTQITDNVGSGVSLTDGTPLLIEDSTIARNTGRGALTTGQGQSKLSVFTSTIADNAAGGVVCSMCAQTIVSESVITGNGTSATAGGGGGIQHTFDLDPAPTNPLVTVIESFVANNHAEHPGGGLYVKMGSPAEVAQPQPLITIDSSTFESNTTDEAAHHGGGAEIETGDVVVSQSVFDGNSATGPGARGGGLSTTERVDDGIANPRNLLLTDVKFTGNQAAGSGGGADLVTNGILQGDLLTATGNTAGGDGGGLSVQTRLTALDRVRANANTGARGGGISIGRGGSGPTAGIARSAIDANVATVHGGGIASDDVESTIDNSTITGNSAPEGGGVSLGVDPMDEGATTTLRASTLVANSAPVGANLIAYEETLVSDRSIVASPLGGGANCSGFASLFTPAGYSYLGDTTCGVAATDVVRALDPLLGGLAMNGGSTPTRLPSAASPVGGIVPPAECVAFDQRDVSRPRGAACEPGAAEIVEAVPLVGNAGPNSLTGTAKADVILGKGGKDVLSGLAGNDRLEGGPGDDQLDGGDGNDLLVGGVGNDRLVGGPGIDILIGDAPGDVLIGGAGPDLCWPVGAHKAQDC